MPIQERKEAKAMNSILYYDPLFGISDLRVGNRCQFFSQLGMVYKIPQGYYKGDWSSFSLLAGDRNAAVASEYEVFFQQ